MLSAATAPTARADDFSDIVAQVEGDFTAGQADFTAADTDFGSNDVTAGLANLYDGIDQYFLSAPQDFAIGTSEALDNETLAFPDEWGFTTVTSFSQGLGYAEGDFTIAQGYLSDAAEELTAGDYGYATYYDMLGADYASIIPLEELLLGAGASF
jgi:hypothetical protein